MLRSHSPSNLPERGGALSFAQQLKLVTPEFQALISSCTKVRALRAIVPALTAGETPRPAAGRVAKQVTRTEGTTRVRGKTPPPGPLAALPPAPPPTASPPPARRRRRRPTAPQTRRQAENRAAAASLLGLGL